MIPELAASTINSPLPNPSAVPDRRVQAAFQRQLDQARDERQPDAAGKPESTTGETAEPGGTQAAQSERQTERLRNQASNQRKTRTATAPTQAVTDKPAASQTPAATEQAADAPARQADGHDSPVADSAADEPTATATASTAAPACDPTLSNLLATSQPRSATGEPAVSLQLAGGQASADVTAGAAPQAARGTRHAATGTGAGGHERGTAAAGLAAASGAAGDPVTQTSPMAGASETTAGGAFEGKLAQARQSLPAELLRGMTSPAGNELGALQARLDAAVAPASAAPVTMTAVESPVGSQAFAPEFTERISTMIDGGIERAEILVTPKDMGPVRIELTLSGEDARLVFTATQPETRQAIEQSSALLRSMLAERGLSLGSMDINQGNAGNPQHARQPEQGTRNSHSPSVAAQAPLIRAGGPSGARRGLLDLFA